MALGMAATIRIGFRIGANEVAGARTTALIAFLTTAFVAISGAILIYLFKEVLVGFYTTEQAVMNLSITLLLFVVFFMFFDEVQCRLQGHATNR